MDKKATHRKLKLRELIDARYGGSQVALASASGLTEGRISQAQTKKSKFL